MMLFKRIPSALAALSLYLLTPWSAAQAEVDSLLNWTDIDALKVYHVYAASDGKSYAEEMAVPAVIRQSGSGPTPTYFDLSDVYKVRIGRGKSGAIYEWHPAAEYRHLIIPLQGELFFDLGDGRTVTLKPGEAVYAEDWTGRGHRSGCAPSKERTTCVAMDMLIDKNPKAMPLRSPPGAGK
ncbi:MAG: hypothetical protein ABW169_13310 [Sphingobium sp.]